MAKKTKKSAAKRIMDAAVKLDNYLDIKKVK